MKKISFFNLIIGFFIFSLSFSALNAHEHVFLNSTDGTVQVIPQTAVGVITGYIRQILPGKEVTIDVAGFCITNIQVLGLSGPIKGFSTWYVPKGNFCAGHSYTISQVGIPRYIRGSSAAAGGSGTQQITQITIGGNQPGIYDPRISIEYQNNPFVLENGALTVEQTS